MSVCCRLILVQSGNGTILHCLTIYQYNVVFWLINVAVILPASWFFSTVVQEEPSVLDLRCLRLVAGVISLCCWVYVCPSINPVSNCWPHLADWKQSGVPLIFINRLIDWHACKETSHCFCFFVLIALFWRKKHTQMCTVPYIQPLCDQTCNVLIIPTGDLVLL